MTKQGDVDNLIIVVGDFSILFQKWVEKLIRISTRK